MSTGVLTINAKTMASTLLARSTTSEWLRSMINDITLDAVEAAPEVVRDRFNQPR